jgi:HEPN domain-containing protein
MDEAKSEMVQAWLVKAHHDLLSARKLSDGPDPLLDTAIYHCQQSAEKAIKALLVLHDQPFEKTHDVGVLLRLAVTYESSLSAMTVAADQLSRYAVIYRYPSDEPEPEREEFD